MTGEFYRGRAVGGLGGAIGQTILLSGPIADPATEIQGLDSLGGWVQLKYKPVANFEVNFAYGQDNPFAGELRMYPASAILLWLLTFAKPKPICEFHLSRALRRAVLCGIPAAANVHLWMATANCQSDWTRAWAICFEAEHVEKSCGERAKF